MTYEGVLTKMQTELGNPIHYYLVFENSFLNLNQLLDKELEISFQGYQCLNCGKKKKIFRQGFCYDCFMSSASAGDWIMKPELSTAHLDIEDRDLEYEKKVQLQPHIVYLALSSEVKVGVTRKTQVPTRWIDQGAVQAIPIVEVPNRYLAGITEVALKNHFADIGKMVLLGSGSEREIPDIALTRYGCYLIAQNGDSSKSEIAFAQTYFAVQTRRQEIIEKRLLDVERVTAREKLSKTEKKLSGIIYERGVDEIRQRDFL